ncbi:MAG: hypothetical protein Q9M50_00520 [Methylococcales bacterium]|nr:hypothetical protein [Methylococcales bacterium]
MKIKLISLIFLLFVMTSCATITRENKPLKLKDGSSVFIENEQVIKIIDKTGKIVSIEKGVMLELVNGNFIYIRRDGKVNNLKTPKPSKGHSH